jgi:serine/threonine-protein kinase
MSHSTETRRYEVLHVLGRGGFGTVYRARLLASGGFRKEVALKVLHADLATSEDVVRRLRDEARMLGLLRHRAIVHVDGLVRLDDRWAIVMEYVDGASLRDILDRGPIPPGVALEICEEVAAALDVAFARKTSEGASLHLLHRDIKPGNIQVTSQGEVKLLDFGVARAEFGGREAKTSSLIFGSLAYLAPERMDFEDTHKGDIYALGVTLYECLVGKALDKASINPRKHRDQVEAALHQLRTSIRDPDLCGLVADCLAYEPDERPDARTFERRARELRRSFPHPWLRDWAESAVPAARSARRPDAEGGELDHWSGTVLDETPATGADTTLAFDPSPAADTGPAVPTLSSEGERSTARPQRKNRVWAWALGLVGTVLVLIVAVAVVVPVLTGVGLVAALRGSGLWDEAWTETVQDSMVELDRGVNACQPAPAVERTSKLLKHLHKRDMAIRVGLLEIAEFETLVESAIQDGILTDAEAREIESVALRISAS